MLSIVIFHGVCVCSCCLLCFFYRSWLDRMDCRGSDINKAIKELNDTDLQTRAFQLSTDQYGTYIEIKILEKPKSRFPKGFIGIEFSKFQVSIRSNIVTQRLKKLSPRYHINRANREIKLSYWSLKPNLSQSNCSSELDLSNDDFDFLSIDDEEVRAWEPSPRV